ncbi:venom carboxylesterase-6 [Anthonomus grandis grandis]|uniref:venom carboxylesterase-6 n=1 Tax=Anthonomus grandis grandis TaxID=2921223 RepID=UPI002166ACB6|nr:venom carboxylesterase-6 [Anthonomus grandis grandis]
MNLNFVFSILLLKIWEVLTSDGECSRCNIPEVKCAQGTLVGKILKSKEGRDIFSFTGIPFAKPPLGDLRFKPPVSYGPWKGVFNATKIHAVCPQRDIYRRSVITEGEEDCLYLNVYSPQLPTKTNNTRLPVMVFFHGGGWLCGGGNTIWYGPDFLIDRDVVLVVTNYRLGALGFLSTGDHVAPGNNGLKDQNLALKWVQTNIQYFGGDPKSVTIFGESAGGASVHYHMLSPMSKGLFHKGIALSGTALTSWALAPEGEGISQAKKLAESFSCPTDCTEELVECLRKIDAIEIVKKDVIFMEWDTDPMIPFKPRIEPKGAGAFLTDHPINIIKSGKSAPVPLILGITSEDGALRAAGILNNNSLLEELNKNFKTLAPISLIYDKTAPNVDAVTSRIRKFYFGNDKIDWSKKTQLIDMYTDGWFLNAVDETILLHNEYVNQPIYSYVFGHRGVASFTKIFGGGDKDYGVCHADDLQYLFPITEGLFGEKFTEDDSYVSKLFTTLFANFAKTGTPTPKEYQKELIPEVWQPVDSKLMNYYHISAKAAGMREKLYQERVELWRSLDSNPRPGDPSWNQRDEL